jgi:hypothetical protein
LYLTHTQGESGGFHSYRAEEVRAFAEYINKELQNDPNLVGLLPLDPANHDQFFNALHDGVILWYVIIACWSHKVQQVVEFGLCRTSARKSCARYHCPKISAS